MSSVDSPTGAQPEALQPWRPLLHLTPSRSRMTDPNGLVWHASMYHLYYQCSADPRAAVSWGHATSPDLLHWTEHPVAIAATASESVTAGSVVEDLHDTTGLGGGAPALVAVYTATDPATGGQHQALAASADGGYTWQRLPDGPLLAGSGSGGSQIRDPRVFWYPPRSCWVMVATPVSGSVVQFWCSDDLLSWELVGRFGPFGPPQARWEVPDLVEVPIDADPEGRSRWLLALSVNPRPGTGGSGMVYAVGDFDGRSFVPTQDGDAFGPFSWVDHGPDFYAATSFAHDPARTGPQNSPVWVGWLGNWAYADVVPTTPWRGVQSLPRTLRLARNGDRYRLVQRPVPEIATARDGIGTRLLHVVLPADTGEGPVRRRVPGAGGTCLEVRIDVEVGPGASAGVEVLASADGAQYTRVTWSQESGLLCLDRRESGVSGFHPDFAALATGPLEGSPVTEGPAAGGRRVRFAVWVDVCCVEAFGGDGETVLSAQVFPDGDSGFLSMFAEGGPVVVRELQVWPLRPPAAPV
ncbi:MAG TPA: glycoside hydrolase family 32 protein [Kineosporiaceae bacterium]|nr:glycoside hydrolase family 32 protein [Kineosporiaceae bacterium]